MEGVEHVFYLTFLFVFFECHDVKKPMKILIFNFSKWLGTIKRNLSNFL